MKKNTIIRILALVIAIVMVLLCFAGCKKGNEPAVNDSSLVSDTTDSKQEEVSSKEDVSSTDTSADSSSSDTESEKPTTSSQPKPSSKPANTTKPTVSSTPTPSQPQAPAKKTAKELIVGKWKGKEDVAAAFEGIGYEIAEGTLVDVGMEFTASGTFIATMDSNAFKSILKPVLEQEFEKQRVAEGISKEDFDAAMLQEFGMTTAEYIEYTLQYFDQGFNFVSEYKFAGDTLLIKELEQGNFVECEYEFTDDNILVTIEEEIRTTYKRVL